MQSVRKSLFKIDYDIHQRMKDLARSRPRIKGITIDRPGTNILDDGISIERERPYDGWTVRVSVVDLPALIPEGHALERKAREMGEEHWERHKMERLFPYEFMRDHVSFSTDAPRPAITFKIRLGGDLAIQETSVYRSMFQSRGKFSTSDINAEIENGNIQMADWADLARKLHERRLNAIASIADSIAARRDMPAFPDCYETVVISLNPGNTIVHEVTMLAKKLAADFLGGRGVSPTVGACCKIRADIIQPSCNAGLEAQFDGIMTRIVDDLSLKSPPLIRMSSPMRNYDSYQNIKMIGKILDRGYENHTALAFEGTAGRRYEMLRAQAIKREWSQAVKGQGSVFAPNPDSIAGFLLDACRSNDLPEPAVAQRSLIIDNQQVYLAGILVPSHERSAVFAASSHHAVALEMAAFRMMHILSRAYPGRIAMPDFEEDRPDLVLRHGAESGLHLDPA